MLSMGLPRRDPRWRAHVPLARAGRATRLIPEGIGRKSRVNSNYGWIFPRVRLPGRATWPRRSVLLVTTARLPAETSGVQLPPGTAVTCRETLGAHFRHTPENARVQHPAMPKLSGMTTRTQVPNGHGSACPTCLRARLKARLSSQHMLGAPRGSTAWHGESGGSERSSPTENAPQDLTRTISQTWISVRTTGTRGMLARGVPGSAALGRSLP